MAAVTPYPQAVNPEFQAGLGVNNQAYQPGQPEAFNVPPPYSPQYPQQPPLQQGAVGYYPNQYPAAPMVYAPQPYQAQQNQQTTAVIINSPPQVVFQQAPYASYCGMIVFACLVFWFCSPLFGLIAFILAVVAENTKGGDPNGARKLGKASMWLSIVGIIVTVIIIVVAVSVSASTAAKVATSKKSYSRYVGPYTCCSSNGYVYPGSGSYCYGDVYSSSSSYYSSCPSYYYSYAGTCYSSRYSLTAYLCCYSYEYSYSSSYCYSY